MKYEKLIAKLEIVQGYLYKNDLNYMGIVIVESINVLKKEKKIEEKLEKKSKP